MNDTYERVPAIFGRLIISLISASSVAGLSTRFVPIWGLWFWIILVSGTAICFLCLCIFGLQPKTGTDEEWRG